MADFTDFFIAIPDDGEDASTFTGFENDSGTVVPGGTLSYRFGVVGYGTHSGVVGCGGTFTTRLFGPYSTVAGVHGTARDFTGVAGTSLNHVGVYGQVEDGVPVPVGIHAGVLGAASTQPGVIGFSIDNDAVQGFSPNSTGLRGISFGGQGVNAYSGADTGVTGVSASEGPSVPNTPNIAGVLGSSDRQHGVIGTSKTSVGVIGFSNNIGVLGFTTTPGALAGQFIGNIQVTGTKAAVVPFPDGTHRALYCMESPDLWFEDFGTAKLKSGRALVQIDADFAKVIKPAEYKVFLTSEGDCRGLYVRGKSAASFEVRELMGGKSSITFCYRIVGLRKDIRGTGASPKSIRAYHGPPRAQAGHHPHCVRSSLT
jgi:hypothetical protein